MKIKGKLFSTILVMSSFMLMAGYVSHRSEKRALENHIYNHLFSVAALQQARLANMVSQNFERLKLVASRTQLRISLRQFLLDGRKEHQERMQRILIDARNSITSFRKIDILDLDGRIAASTDEKVVDNQRFQGNESCFAQAVDGKSTVDFFLDPAAGQMLLLCGPLYLEGETLGVIVIDSEAANIVAAVTDYTGLEETGETLLIEQTQNGDALFLAPTRFDPEAALKRTVAANGKNSPSLLALSDQKPFFTEGVDYRGEHVVATGRTIEETGWAVVVKFDKNEAYSPLRYLRQVLFAMTGGFILIIVIVVVYITRSITSPLAGLTNAAAAITKGETVTVDASSKDEIGILAEAFNTMTRQLTLANAELEQRVEERTRQLADSHTELHRAYEDLKVAQSRILQQEKMASIGQLAAGVAHEINNPTGFILSNLGTLGKYAERLIRFQEAQTNVISKLAMRVEAGASELEALEGLRKSLKIKAVAADLKDLVAESIEGGERIKKIVLNLKSFARLDEAELQQADINQCLDSTLNTVWNELKYKCTIKKEYGDIPLIKCNPGQLNQVFMNLLVNAGQAIENQGEVRISTRQDNGFVEIHIEDTGSGIPPDKLSRIFEPFFTTRDVGKGTGLGLSIAYDIIKSHGGEISAESKIGTGTCFKIHLPVETGCDKIIKDAIHE